MTLTSPSVSYTTNPGHELSARFKNGSRAIEDSYGIVWIVDQDGRSNESFLIENFTPERKTRRVIVRSEGGVCEQGSGPQRHRGVPVGALRSRQS